MTKTQTLTLVDREKSNGASRWIVGSRERYGVAYFVSREADGAFRVWENRMPFAVNEPIGTISTLTWEALDALIYA